MATSWKDIELPVKEIVRTITTSRCHLESFDYELVPAQSKNDHGLGLTGNPVHWSPVLNEILEAVNEKFKVNIDCDPVTTYNMTLTRTAREIAELVHKELNKKKGLWERVMSVFGK